MRHSNFIPFVGESWIFPLQEAFNRFHEEVIPFTKEKKKTAEVFPKDTLVLRAFKEVPYESVRVVILGQYPYPSEYSTGLAFDAPRWCMTPALRNIIKEIHSDVGFFSGVSNTFSHFEHLPPQGVLLINAALTNSVFGQEEHTAAWRGFIEEVVKALQKRDNIVWVLWGKRAGTFTHLLLNKTHKVVEGANPSPFSYHLFKGGKYFSKINALIKGPSIIW